MGSTNLMKSASIIAIWTMLSKILGFLRETALASRFGATSATDAYLVAMIIPSLFLLGIGPAVATTVIPVFADLEKRHGRDRAFASANNVFNVCLLVAVAVSLIGIIAANQIVRVAAPGFSGETFKLTVQLTRILFPIAIFQTASSVFTGLLQSLGKFGLPAFAGLMQNVLIISSIVFFGPRYGITAVAVGTVLGAAGMFAIKIPALLSAGYKYHFSIDWGDEGLRQLGRLIVPMMAGSAAGQLGIVIMRMLASTLPEGSITYLNYAQRLVALPSGILGTALVTVLYPTLARMYASGFETEFIRTLERSVRIIVFLLIPMAAGMMILAIPIVRLAFERGVFTAEATVATATALFYLAIAIPAVSLTDLAIRTFYALRDTLTPVFVNIGAIGVAVALRLFLVDRMGYVGLALAGACQPIVSFSVLYVILNHRMRAVSRASRSTAEQSWAASLAKSFLAAAAMWVIIAPLSRWLEMTVPGNSVVPQAARLAIAVIVGAVVYFGTAALLKSEELSFLASTAKKRIEAWG